MARSSRNSEQTNPSREIEARDDVWTPPTLLDAPPARPGFRQHWVATSILGKDIPHQTLKRFREGWTPRKADTVPKDFQVPTITHGEFDGVVGVEGMILCEMPESKAQSRDRYYAGKVDELNGFVKNNLNKVSRQGGTAIEHQHDRSSSRGQKIADDE